MKNKHKDLYISILKEYEKLSTCSRLHVAALLVKDGRVVSVGYNGTMAGQCHCNKLFKHDGDTYQMYMQNKWNKVDKETFLIKHHEFSEENEIHAEMNCIAFALKNNISINECDMILSVSPCGNCAKLIASSGIKNVYYLTEYDRSNNGIAFLRKHGVNVEWINII